MDFNNKGKSMTTSTPSMAIRFNASAEEIEEIYSKEDDQNEQSDVLPVEKSTDVESSPRRSILPILTKRSTSVDVNSASAQDSSPPSDPWKFLSDIKGKITKSVEVKFTEYKSRTMENESSPKLNKPVKDSKDNSSLSDSEEASESSISRTCGIVSTTEGVEMSSDDETPSLSEEDKQNHDNTQYMQTTSTSSMRQRFRITGKRSTTKEGSVNVDFLDNIQRINDGVAGLDANEIESGVDVLADLNISNIEIDNENVLNIKQVTGSDIRAAELDEIDDLETIFSPLGFVDLRREEISQMTWFDIALKFRSTAFTVICLCFYFYLPLTVYTSGFIAGGLALSVVWCLYIKLCLPPYPLKAAGVPKPIVEIPAAEEHQPFIKYEGWVNEYPEEYNPLTYHVCQTQSVYLRLQGHFLKVSHTRQKIPKRAMWNEQEHKLIFTRHRIYNLLGAKVLLLPEGLARVRQWSKKYPICIVLNSDQVDIEIPGRKVKESKGKEVKMEKKSEDLIDLQVYSKLVNSTESQASALTVPEQEEIFDDDDVDDLDFKATFDEDDDDSLSNINDWQDVAESVHISPNETRIYIFGRTGREKEDWFRRMRLAACGHAQNKGSSLYDEYLLYMKMQKVFFGETSDQQQSASIQHHNENFWVNALLARVLFDAAREETTVQRIKERIQRKLVSIKLPHFIQALYCEQLNLGTSAPIILGSTKPVLNDRGIWVDLDISYEGLAGLILQTKVNLLKLKYQHTLEVTIPERIDDKPAIYHSDIDDSAESSTDEESSKHVSSAHVLDSKGMPIPGIGGTSNRSKKLMKMVDRIAESKFFQAATENKYIKRAMQEFSNTDLRLKVEVKKCIGTLVINIPPPPSDRVWCGFRVPPELIISAQPIVGDRNIGFMRVTNWIEKKIYKEFQKIFVIPNMEDLLIPVMSPKLPE